MDQEELNMLSAFLSSDIKCGLLRLFRNNPKLTFNSQELAKQMGRIGDEIQPELTHLVEIGVIKKIGNQECFRLDENKDRDFQTQIFRYLLRGVNWAPRSYCERFC